MQTKSIDENEFEYEGKTYVSSPSDGGCANEHLGYAIVGTSNKWTTAFFSVCTVGGFNAAKQFLDFLAGEKEINLSEIPGEERQAARFMLLHFAALYFEDLGE
jgi:hypothetical protein